MEELEPSKQDIEQLVNFYQNSQYNDAERLALSLTKKFPEHQLSWKVLGSILRMTGRISEALIACQNEVKFGVNDSESYNNLGVTLQKLGRFEEAEENYKESLAIDPKYVLAHYNLGNVYRETGKFKEAKSKYMEAIELAPNLAEAHSNLAIVQQALGGLDDAKASYLKAIDLKPGLLEAHLNLGAVYHKMGRLDDAEVKYRQTIELESNFPEAYNNFGNTLKELGRLDEAEKSYRKAIELKQDFDSAKRNLGLLLYYKGQFENAIEFFKDNKYRNSQTQLLSCYFMLNDQSRFYEQLDLVIEEGKIDAIIGSLILRSEIKFGIKRDNVFVNDPFQFVTNIDLNKNYNFKDIFVKPIMDELNEEQVNYMLQPLLTNGKQTYGNIFQNEIEGIKDIEKIIMSEIDKYRTQFQHFEEGFLKNWPKNYTISGWLINMKNGGELAPHIHEDGWVSGAVYINVPNKKHSNSGNFVVSFDEDLPENRSKEKYKQIINVVTGSLVLFPSSLMHYTIPFESDEERIVLAFDIKPK